MERVVFPEVRCIKCGGEVIFCQLVDTARHTHVRLWCDRCNRIHKRGVSKQDRTKYRLKVDQLPEYVTKTQRMVGRKNNGEPVPVLPVDTKEPPSELRQMPYSQYLKSNHWKALRRKVLYEACFKCQLCNGTDRLNVHHRTYDRRGNEALSDLTVLCESCHAKFHDKLPKT